MPEYLGRYLLEFKTTYYGCHKDSGGQSDWAKIRAVTGHAVYQIDAGDGNIYVGMSRSVYGRINDHTKKHPQLALLRHNAWAVDVWSCHCEYTASAFESQRIRQYGTINRGPGRVNHEWILRSTGLLDWVLAWLSRNDWLPTSITPDGDGFSIVANKNTPAMMGGV